MFSKNTLIVFICLLISTLSLSISPLIRAETVCNSPSLTIPDKDNTGVTDTLSISDSGNITDINIIMDVDHGHLGELTFILEHEGTSVILMDQPGIPNSPKGCLGKNLVNLILDDEGIGSVENDCAPSDPAYENGFPYQPNGSLSDFDNMDIYGDWTLTIVDNHDFSIDHGMLKKWCVEYERISSADLSLEPPTNPPLDFGGTVWGETSSYSITLAEGGNDKFVIYSAEITGDPPDDFTLTAVKKSPAETNLLNPTLFPLTIAIKETYAFEIECNPSTTGLRQATFTLTTNIPSYSTIEYPLQCTGLAASYSADLNKDETINFGESDVGTTTANQSFDINNTSNDVNLALSANITGTEASDFQIVTVPISPVSTGGGSTTIELNCTPSAGGLRQATLELTTNDPDNQTVSYPLQCTGKAPIYDEPKFSPSSTVAFGIGYLNASIAQSIEIKNTGNQDLTVSANLSGDAVFSITTSLSFVVPIGSVGNLGINCTIPNSLPTDPTDYIATLKLAHNDPLLASPVTYELTCTGTEVKEPLYDSTPAPGETINMGSSVVGTTISNTFTIQEMGNATLEVTNWEITGDNATDFNITTSFPITVNDGDAEEIVTVECTPSEEGKHTATLKLFTNVTNASNYPNPTYPLECNGLVAGYKSNTANSLNLGETPVGQSITKSIRIEENGDADLIVDLATDPITGTHADEFSIKSPKLSSFPLTIINDSDKKKWIRIQCTPTGLGTRTAQLNLTSNDPSNPTPTYDLKCTGKEAVGPGYDSTPTLPGETIDFGSVPVGITATETFDIQEIGTAVLDIDLDSTAISGTHKNDFSIDSPIFPFYISDNGTDVTVTITCQPSAEGLRTATLHLTSSDPLNPNPSYDLECEATPALIPGYSSTPAPESKLDIGSSLIGENITQTIEIEETGNTDLTITLADPAITGDHADDFSLLNPSFPLTISDGDSTQNLKVQCQPSEAGTRTATLKLKSNDPNHQTATYQLQCTGTSPPETEEDTEDDTDTENDTETNTQTNTENDTETNTENDTETNTENDTETNTQTNTQTGTQTGTTTQTQSVASKVTLTVKMAGLGTGRVTSNPAGINCTTADGECQQTFDTATQMTLSVIADKGSEFQNRWSGCPNGKVFLTGNTTCTAYLNLSPKTLTINAVEHGTISSTPAGILCGSSGNQCTHAFDGGLKVNLTITPDNGWQFDNWQGCQVNNGQIAMMTNLTCQPQFVPQPATPDDLEITAQDCKIGGKLDFGTQPIGTSTTETITITNTGNTALPLSELSLPAGLSLVDSFPESVAALETITFQIQLDGTEVGTYDGILSFKSDNETVFSCPIEGTVIVEATLPDNTSTTQTTEEVADDTSTETNQTKPVVPAEKPINYTLTITKRGTGSGSINSEPSGIFCGMSCLADYLSRTEVKLTARAEVGSTFIGWRGDCSDSDNNIAVTITKSLNCEAQFDQVIQDEEEKDEEVENSLESEEINTPVDEISYTLTVTKLGTGNGTIISQITGIQCDPDCNFDYFNQTKVILTAIADDNSRFIGWDEACRGTDRQFTLTMEQNQHCTATFDKKLEETTTASPNIEKPCPLIEYINEVCNLGGETARYAIIGSQANISNVVLEGTTTNLGWVGNALLTEGSSLRGGVLTGYFTNQGLLADFDFRGAVLEGGMLSGMITNHSPIKGIIKDAYLAANTTISEGRVGGYLIGDADAPARLDNLRVTSGTYLENIIIGNNVDIWGDVTYGPGVRFIDQPAFISEEHIDQVVQADGEIFRDTIIGPNGKLSNLILAGTIHNQGQISGATLQENGYLSGGILKKQILNQGMIADVKLKGHLIGGILAGSIESSKKAIIQNVQLAQNAKLKGGTLQGEVTGDPDFPAYVEAVTLAPNSRVSHVIIGQDVVNDGHCTISDFEFRGTTLTGCQLGGSILNTMGGTLTDVQFAPNAHLIGGNLTGNIVGNTDVLLENVSIPAGSYLENVIIGNNVKLSEHAARGPGVTYLNEPNEPHEPKVVATALLIHPNGDVQVEPNADFMSGIMDRNEKMYLNQAMLTYSQAEFVTLATQMTILPEHVGQTADLLMVALYEDKDRKANYMRVGQEWLPWDNQISSLEPTEIELLLPESLPTWVYHNDLRDIAPLFTFMSNGHQLSVEDVAGKYQFYVGYRLADGTLVFNGLAPIDLFVERGPASCILYALHDDGLNNSQVITINLCAGLKGDMKPLGPLYKGRDMEGLAVHPSNKKLLFGSAGDHAKIKGLKNNGAGYLYTIHRETGELTIFGPTGFDKVSGLAFHPVENSLWAWARNETSNPKWSGLIKIDPDTGEVTPIKQFDYKKFDMGGLAWNYEGTLLYATDSANRNTSSTLWAYNPDTQKIDVACKKMVNGRVEALDLQPNGFLLASVDRQGQSDKTSIIAYDPVKCKVVHTRTFKNMRYNDIESIVWPGKECNDLSWLSDKSGQ